MTRLHKAITSVNKLDLETMYYLAFKMLQWVAINGGIQINVKVFWYKGEQWQ